MSPNEAHFNLRERNPLSHILHKAPKRLMRQRPNSDRKSYRDWSGTITNPKDEAGHLSYPASGRDSSKRGLGCEGKCHLNYLAESVFVNVGDCYQDAKMSSPSMFDNRVGAVIVVGAWESQAHAENRRRCFAGEGPQSVGTSSANVIECQHRGISYEYR